MESGNESLAMEESNDLIMLEQARLFRGWLAEVADQCSRRISPCTVCGHEARLHIEVSGMTIPVALLGVHIGNFLSRVKLTCPPSGEDQYTSSQQIHSLRSRHSKH